MRRSQQYEYDRIAAVLLRISIVYPCYPYYKTKRRGGFLNSNPTSSSPILLQSWRFNDWNDRFQPLIITVRRSIASEFWVVRKEGRCCQNLTSPEILYEEEHQLIAILDCVDDICRGAQLCAPTRRVLYPIKNCYELGNRYEHIGKNTWFTLRINCSRVAVITHKISVFQELP